MKKLPQVAERFLRYVEIDTQADPTSHTSPTSQGQWELAQLLVKELEEMGADEVELTEQGIVLATIFGTGPTVGFLAHLDTSPATAGGSVRPMIHHYQGGKLTLPHGEIDHPLLAEARGCRIITSDGSTLLGADDKAGIAAIMEAARKLLAQPRDSHAKIRIAFTPDEELGLGTKYLDLNKFAVDAAYTVDGGALGELEWENFNAQNLRIIIQGKSSHPGQAKGRMVNAARLAALFVSSLPATALPETTDGRDGFIHVDKIQAEVEEATLEVILRDFCHEELVRKRNLVEKLLAGIVEPGSYSVQELGGYINMKEAVVQNPSVVKLALQAMEEIGVEPRERLIRGGTDGAKLAQANLACPNLFTGGVDFHSRTEWLVVEWLEQAQATVTTLAQLWKA